MNQRASQVDVIVEDGINEQEREAIRTYLDEQGVSITLDTADMEEFRQGVSAVLTRFDPGNTGSYGKNGHLWGVLLHARVNEFVRQVGAENLRDTVEGLRKLRANQTGSSPGKGLVMLIDEDTGIRFDLEPQLPVNAYRDLEGMRISTFESDPLKFHRKSGPNGRWRSPR